MKIEKKDSKTIKSKITMLYPSEAETRDPAVDRLLEESLIQEADVLDASMEGDPRLAGLEAPDGLFDKIVAQLKEEGKWEEDPPGQTEAEEKEKARGQEKDQGTGKSRERTERTDIEKTRERMEIDIEKARKREYASDAAKKYGQTRTGDTERSQEQAYAMLSEEDRQALEIGRSVLREEHGRKKKTGRWQKAVRRSGIAAAVFVAAFGLAMTSEANRRTVGQIWESVVGQFGLWTVTNYSNDEEIVRDKSNEEEQAMREIREKTEIPPINLAYLPYGTEFLDYIIRGEEAEIFYTLNEKIIRVLMMHMTNSVYYYTLDQNAVLKETINTFQNQEAKIWETTAENGVESYMAEIEYDNCKYLINAVVSLKEMERIVENIIFMDSV